MHYEPVGYIIEYEICAIVFLLVIILRYFSARRFPNQKNTLFSVLLCVIACDMTLDVISSLVIDNIFSVPSIVVHLVNGNFYIIQIALPLLMTAYTFMLGGYINKKRLLHLLPFSIPGVLTLLAMLTNPFTHWFFYVDPVRGYVHGKLFVFTYLGCMFYIVLTLCAAFCFRKRMRRIEFSSIVLFLFIVTASMIIQFFYPPLLISGVSMALAVVLMYFTIQNPENMLDSATGAFTYEALQTFLRDRAMERNRVQIVAVKILNMKNVNDVLGLEKGGRLLAHICAYMTNSVDGAWIFRMKSDCFVAVTRKHDNYAELARKIESRLSQPWSIDGTEVMVQATIFCVETSDLGTEPLAPEQLMNYLDIMLQQPARAVKKGKLVFGGHEMMDRIERTRKIEVAFREALETGEGLEIYLQPLWSIKKQRFTSAEVLLRFNHPELGRVSPSEFVPIAENNGMIIAMDDFVVRRTCAFLQSTDIRRVYGIESVEINLSALEFTQSRFVETLDKAVRQYRVDPSLLIFEVTETAATESFELLYNCMHELCMKGYRFALDDFGTGYANISQVISLPFSMVKLDSTLFYGSSIVLEDMARMFTRMKLYTVVEGVETPEQASLVNCMDVDYIQGFHYAKPMDKQDFIAFLNCPFAYDNLPKPKIEAY